LSGLQEETPFTLKYGIQGVWYKEKKLILKEADVKYDKTVSAILNGVDVRDVISKVRSGKVYSNKTASDIAIDIAKLNGWKTDRVVPTKHKYTNVAVGHKSYSQILAELSWQENYRYLIEDNSLIFEPAFDLSKTNRRVYTYWIGRNPDVLSFQVKSKSDAAGGASTKSKKLDPKTGKPVTSTPGNVPSVGKGKSIYKVAYTKGGGYTANLGKETPSGNVDAHPDASKDRATAHATKASWKFVEASITVLSDPIEVGDIIEVNGVAVKHAGAYKVTSSRFAIDGGFMKVTAKISRNTTPKTKGGKKETKDTPQSGSGKDGQKKRYQVDYTKGGGYTAQVK